MSFPRFHIQTFPALLVTPVQGLTQRLHGAAALGALAGLAFATAGLLLNSAILPGLGSVAPSQAQVVASVSGYINQWQPSVDPLINLEGVGQVKTSNVEGVQVGSERYYYRMASSASFDPVSRGRAERYKTIAVLDEGTDWEVEIYQVQP
ncbi:MAG: hypothetical protein EXR52_02885 [Dehalococcoidia bacterium]|nr:hypothetical protein [Dehalococcoidia bacterium]